MVPFRISHYSAFKAFEIHILAAMDTTITEDPIKSLIPTDDVAEATMGIPGIRSVSSMSDTSMVAGEDLAGSIRGR